MVRSTLARISAAVAEPVSPYSLAAFRIVFGLLLLHNVVKSLLTNSVFYNLEATRFKFSYPGFAWLEPLPGRGLTLLWICMVVAALMLTLGLCYRASAAFFALGWTYSFLLDSANYNNADYLVALLTALLIFIPAHRAWSLDNVWRRRAPMQVRRVWVLVLQAQFLIMYVGGGIAKINWDWLHGGPLTILLAERSDMALVGPLFTLAHTGLVLSWFGLAFDLSIVFLIMYRRTRWLGFACALGFHGMNSQLFTIGYFPWLSLFALTLFLSPDWPRTLLTRVKLGKYAPEASSAPAWKGFRKKLVLTALAAYVLVQALVPLRHFVAADNYAWEDNGNGFAWHMISSYKTGFAEFTVRSEGEELYRGPAYNLTPTQRANLIGRPDAIRQYAHYLALQEQHKHGLASLPEVYVTSMVSMNGREPQLLLDPHTNMADQPRYFFTPDYVNRLHTVMPDHETILKNTLEEVEKE